MSWRRRNLQQLVENVGDKPPTSDPAGDGAVLKHENPAPVADKGNLPATVPPARPGTYGGCDSRSGLLPFF
jgi:hypothetical protein